MAGIRRRAHALRPPRWSLDRHIVVVIATGVLIATGTFLAVWWLLLGHPALRSPLPNGFEAADRYDLVKIALTVTGGVAAATALVIAYRRQRLAELGHLREDAKLFNERYATAAAQLASERAFERLAGVYALAGLADDWATGRQSCIDVLCGYLRMPYRPPDASNPATSGGDAVEGTSREERQVRQTLVRIIRDHLRSTAPVGWHGYELDFTGAVFDGADFTGATFRDTSVSFRSARFLGERTSFERTVFRPAAEVSFEHAEFGAGVVSFAGAEFAGGRVLFEGASIANGVLDLSKPARWKVPPQLDDWLAQPPEGLRLPGFHDELTATLNSYDGKFVLVAPDTSAKALASVRRTHNIRGSERPIAYASGFRHRSGIACTDRALHVADDGKRVAIQFSQLGEAIFDAVSFDAGVANDQGAFPTETTNVRILHRGAEHCLQFGGPDANAAVLDVLHAVQRVARRHNPPQ